MASALLLSACGGTTVSFEELQERGANYLVAIDDDSFSSGADTRFEDTPMSDEAGYTGIAFVGLVSEFDRNLRFLSVGSTTMVANYEEQSIRGSADNFYEISGFLPDSLEGETGEAIAGNMTYEFVRDESRASADEIPPIGFVGGFAGSINPSTLDEFEFDVEGNGRYVGSGAVGFEASSFSDNGIDPYVYVYTLKD